MSNFNGRVPKKKLQTFFVDTFFLVCHLRSSFEGGFAFFLWCVCFYVSKKVARSYLFYTDIQKRIWTLSDPMNSWADLCEDDDPQPRVLVKASARPAADAKLGITAEGKPKGTPDGKPLPVCYCGETCVLDTVKKAGKREKVGTPFVVCATGQCKYWYTLPVPADLPVVNCFCDKPAAACKVKNPESRFCGRYISSCAFAACKFYKVHA